MSLNYGQIPKDEKGNTHALGDMRVMMYVDRGMGLSNDKFQYTPRQNALLSSAGYYSATSKFGRLTQEK